MFGKLAIAVLAAPSLAGADSAPRVTLTTQPEPVLRWSRAAIERPLTLPEGLFMPGVDVSNTSGDMSVSKVRLLLGYGVTDRFEINFAHYSFSTDDPANGSIDGGIGYSIVRGALDGRFEAVARVLTGYSLDTSTMNPVAIGMQAQYNVTSRIALLSSGSQVTATLSGDSKAIAVTVPVSIGLQVTPTVYAQMDTFLATLDVTSSTMSFLGTNSPVTATVLVNAAMPFDVFATVSVNITPPDDQMAPVDTASVLAGARYYVGRL
jgi:hypothetical protein